MKRTPLKRGTKMMKRTPLRAKSGFRTKKSATGQISGKKTPFRKVTTAAKLKKKLDAVFSKYIRQIHPARCYTCGVSKHRKNLQCGHFISRQYLATRWDERNCRPQCVGCNMYGNGKPLDFEENLKRELGSEVVEAMKASRHQILKLSPDWYEERIKFYQGLVQ